MNAYANIDQLLKKREFDKVEPIIEKRLFKDPDDSRALYFRGIMQYLSGKISSAVRDLRRALEIDPQLTDAAICLSVVLNDIGKYEEAKKVFKLANQSVALKHPRDDLSISKKFALKHLELGDLYFRHRRYDEAIDEYTKAASLDPTLVEAKIRRAKSNAKKGFVSRAIQELQRLKADQPNSTTVRLQLGLLHYSQGNILDAELEWEQVLEIDSGNREASAFLKVAKQARVRV